MKNTDISIEKETILDCPILYSMYGRPMTETCMSFGWECGKGWYENIQNLSYDLETLNRMYYPKYRLRIQADQVKEKFGYLHFYFSIIQDHGKILTSIINILKNIEYKLNKIDYKYKKVIEELPHEFEDIEDSTKEEYEKYQNLKVSNIEFKIEGNKYTKITHLKTCEKSHQEPTKHKFLYALKNIIRKTHWTLDCWFTKKENGDIRRLKRYMENKAHDIISHYEDICYKTCEKCGISIGNEWSPRCSTKGWISYICDKCAENTNFEYFKDGNLYIGKNIIKTKEKLEKKTKNE